MLQSELARAPLPRSIVEMARKVLLHNIIHAPQLLRASPHSLLHSFVVPHIHASYAEHFAPLPRRSDLSSDSLRLLDITTNDAGVCAQVNDGADKSGDDGARAAGSEDDAVGEDVVAPDVGDVFGFGESHGGVRCM